MPVVTNVCWQFPVIYWHVHQPVAPIVNVPRHGSASGSRDIIQVLKNDVENTNEAEEPNEVAKEIEAEVQQPLAKKRKRASVGSRGCTKPVPKTVIQPTFPSETLAELGENC